MVTEQPGEMVRYHSVGLLIPDGVKVGVGGLLW